jgi:hypothetical protein
MRLAAPGGYALFGRQPAERRHASQLAMLRGAWTPSRVLSTSGTRKQGNPALSVPGFLLQTA